MSQSRFSVDHVCLTADKPFEGSRLRLNNSSACSTQRLMSKCVTKSCP